MCNTEEVAKIVKETKYNTLQEIVLSLEERLDLIPDNSERNRVRRQGFLEAIRFIQGHI